MNMETSIRTASPKDGKPIIRARCGGMTLPVIGTQRRLSWAIHRGQYDRTTLNGVEARTDDFDTLKAYIDGTIHLYRG